MEKIKSGFLRYNHPRGPNFNASYNIYPNLEILLEKESETSKLYKHNNGGYIIRLGCDQTSALDLMKSGHCHLAIIDAFSYRDYVSKGGDYDFKSGLIENSNFSLDNMKKQLDGEGKPSLIVSENH